MIQPNTLVLIQIWRLTSKCWRIGVLVNACLNQVKACLVSGARKLGSSALHTGFIKSDLANFLSFPLLLLTTLQLSKPVADKAPAGWELVFNIEVSATAILLKPWTKHRQKLTNTINILISRTDFGSNQALTVSILSSFIQIRQLNTTQPIK